MPETHYQARRKDVLDLHIEHLRVMVTQVRKNNDSNNLFVAGVGTAALTLASIAVFAKLQLGGLTGACAVLTLVVVLCSGTARFGQPPRLPKTFRDSFATDLASFKAIDHETDDIFALEGANPIAVREQLVAFLLAELNMELGRGKRSAEWGSAAFSVFWLTLVLAAIGVATRG